jgi:hypothetical protein
MAIINYEELKKSASSPTSVSRGAKIFAKLYGITPEEAAKFFKIVGSVGLQLSRRNPTLGFTLGLINALSGKLGEDDTQNVRSIIIEGRRQNVDEMEIVMDRRTAIGIDVSGIEGVEVTLGAKGSTHYHIKIKYK